MFRKRDLVSDSIDGGGFGGSWSARLRVPPVPPSGLPHCKLIDTDYWIEVD